MVKPKTPGPDSWSDCVTYWPDALYPMYLGINTSSLWHEMLALQLSTLRFVMGHVFLQISH